MLRHLQLSRAGCQRRADGEQHPARSGGFDVAPMVGWCGNGQRPEGRGGEGGRLEGLMEKEE